MNRDSYNYNLGYSEGYRRAKYDIARKKYESKQVTRLIVTEAATILMLLIGIISAYFSHNKVFMIIDILFLLVVIPYFRDLMYSLKESFREREKRQEEEIDDKK